MIYVINPKFKIPSTAIVVNTTSRSFDWGKGLSPFFVGPIDLYDDFKSINMENAWQFSKCYGHLDHLDENEMPTASYFTWAQAGWNSIKAYRYPMGKGILPICSYWDGIKLDYIEARKKIYLPLYAKAVQKTFAWSKLKKLYESEPLIYLWDFDAHNLPPGTFDYWDLWNNPQIKVGHAYVLAMMLEGII
jgi:hypothetical protein